MRGRFTVAVRNYEMSDQGDSALFPEFASGDQITFYMFYVFKILLSQDLIMREDGKGSWAECGVG